MSHGWGLSHAIHQSLVHLLVRQERTSCLVYGMLCPCVCCLLSATHCLFVCWFLGAGCGLFENAAAPANVQCLICAQIKVCQTCTESPLMVGKATGYQAQHMNWLGHLRGSSKP